MTRLLLGPLLRRVAGARATIWVEAAGPCEVTVVTDSGASGAARTFSAFGRHYALVIVSELVRTTAYRVLLDGDQVWPEVNSDNPPSVIRVRTDGAPVRLVFGSCREATPMTARRNHPPDALDAFAARLAADISNDDIWPSGLLLLGDQVYADEPSRHREHHARTFNEYCELYHESWTDPDVRWLLSTVPSTMMFDDHEIVDDWNTSAVWLATMRSTDWWTDRLTSGLASYWIYQHLGNLEPGDDLFTDPVYQAVTGTSDATMALTDFMAAETTQQSYRWSVATDVGRTRVIVLDTRAGRVLDPRRRSILSEDTWSWLEKSLHGDYDHVVVGTALPWLLPPAIHELEAWDAKLADSPRPWVARCGETLRQTADMEHWAAWGRSFDRLHELLSAARSGRYTVEPPASVCVVSGDVHHTYVARTDSGVYQITCSPIHNEAPHAMKAGFRFGWTWLAHAIARGLARSAQVNPPPVGWHKQAGPYFDNALGVLEHSGRDAQVTLCGAHRGAAGLADLAVVRL